MSGTPRVQGGVGKGTEARERVARVEECARYDDRVANVPFFFSLDTLFDVMTAKVEKSDPERSAMTALSHHFSAPMKEKRHAESRGPHSLVVQTST